MAGAPINVKPAGSTAVSEDMCEKCKEEPRHNVRKEPGDDVWKVLGWAIFSAAALMGAALGVQAANQSMEATKDVLPLCTALVGFAGGAVTAIFGRNIALQRLQPVQDNKPNSKTES